LRTNGGQRLPRYDRRLGITRSDVESGAFIAQKFDNEDFAIPPSRFVEHRKPRASCRLLSTYALAAIYRRVVS